MNKYYEAYKAGYRAGEVAKECFADEGDGLTSPAFTPDINPDAWWDAQHWGYEDALNGADMKSEAAVDMWLDSNYSI